MTLHEIRDERDNELKQINKKLGVFYAFSDAQFKKGMQTLKDNEVLKEGEKVVRLKYGGFVAHKNIDAYLDLMPKLHEYFRKKEIDKVGAEAIIKYELGNHEYGYTYDLTDTIEALKLYEFSNEIISKVAQSFLKECENY